MVKLLKHNSETITSRVSQFFVMLKKIGLINVNDLKHLMIFLWLVTQLHMNLEH